MYLSKVNVHVMKHSLEFYFIMYQEIIFISSEETHQPDSVHFSDNFNKITTFTFSLFITNYYFTQKKVLI